MSIAPKTQLETDSRDYDVLWTAALMTAHVPGASIEIGVRAGGATELILRATAEHNTGRLHIGIDPWGGLPYAMGETVHMHGGYSDEMRRKACADIYKLADELKLDVLLFAMRDVDYYAAFASGVPFYRKGRTETVTSYSLVHIDGEHTTDAVAPAVQFFAPRISPGGMLVMDDVDHFNFTEFVPFLTEQGFVRDDSPLYVDRPNPIKISYVRKA